MQGSGVSVLLVDLNNFTLYPTIPVGSITAALRVNGHKVRLFSPLSAGVSGFRRQRRAKAGGHLVDQARFWSAMTHSGAVRKARQSLRRMITPRSDQTRARIAAAFDDALADRPDVVLVSAYTLYRRVVADLAASCAAQGIPLLVGGPYFNEPDIARLWLGEPGVTAVVAAEPEGFIAPLVEAAARGESLEKFPGVSVQPDAIKAAAPPLAEFGDVPVPDYSDFPWDAYPLRIVPIMTGRGCGWGACQFCSDVTTVMGRSFRSRKANRVLEEIGTLTARHCARHMVFHDLKLNSDLSLWHELLNNLPTIVEDPVWTCAVHTGLEQDNGLSRDELKAARAAGLARITTGLESGSQRVLNSMGKGMQVGRVAQFCADATAADISVRLTTIIGYPGETADDLRKTADFLERNGANVERVMVNRFSVMLGTPIAKRMLQEPERFSAFTLGAADLDEAIVPYVNHGTRAPGYYNALFSVLKAAHKINRRPLNDHAMAFEGVM